MGKIGKNDKCSCGSGRKYKRCHGANGKSSLQLTMPRQEHWRFQYMFRRYLEHLSKEELSQRTNDILSNMTNLTNELKIAFHPVSAEGEFWWKAFTHILEECRLRGIQIDDILPTNFEEIQFPKYDLKGLDKAVEVIEQHNLQTGNYLVKYGKYKYLEPMLMNGSVRIMPALAYDDPSLNSAIKDNELEVSTLTLPNEVKNEEFYKKIKVSVGDKTGYLEDFFELVGNFKYTRTSNSNFYVYCLTYEHSYRMFGDFEADSCLIITKPSVFLKRILEKFNETIPNYSVYHNIVKYYDPLNVDKKSLPAFLSKHFRYAYQKEYRIIWTPSEAEMELKPVFLELGNLEDCCELIKLPNE